MKRGSINSDLDRKFQEHLSKGVREFEQVCMVCSEFIKTSKVALRKDYDDYDLRQDVRKAEDTLRTVQCALKAMNKFGHLGSEEKPVVKPPVVKKVIPPSPDANASFRFREYELEEVE